MIIFVVLMTVLIVFLANLNEQKKKELNELKKMTWKDFELFCAEILKKNGYEIIVHYDKDKKQGVDLLAQKEQKTYAIQCKKYSSLVGCDGIYESLSGKEHFDADIAVVMTNSFFKNDATLLARKENVQLWDGNKIFYFMKHSEEIKEIDKKENYKRRNNKVHGLKGDIYPSGQYVLGEDIPIGKYIFIPDKEYGSNIKLYKSFDDYISGADGKYQSFDKEYFVNLFSKGIYIVVDDCKFKKIDKKE